MNTQRTICAALLTVTLAADLSHAAFSQADTMRPLSAIAYSEGITAHGHGEIKVKPDIARLSAQVTTTDKFQDKAVQDNARKMTSLLTAIKSLKIADKDVQTQGYSVSPQYDYSNGRSHLTGYQVVNSVQITLRELTQTGLLIDTMTQADVNQGVSVDGVSYDLADRAAAQDQALTLAVADARRRAGTMAAALSIPLGNPLLLNDSGSTTVQPIFQTQMRTMNALTSAVPTTPIPDQQITVTADATLVYAMGPAKAP